METCIYIALVFIGYQVRGVKKAIERQNDIAMVKLTDDQREELDDMDLSMDETEEEKAK